MNPDVFETLLAQAKFVPLGTAYDRAETMKQRKVNMASCADYFSQDRESSSAYEPAVQRLVRPGRRK